MNDGPRTPIVPRIVRVWDLPTRIFHWALVAFVTLAWLTGEGKGIWFSLHLGAGIGVLALLLFRLQWGVFGNRHARFADFVRPWSVVIGYAKRLLARAPPRYVGHNPLGGWMVVGLLAVLAAVVITGLFAAGKNQAAPLADLIGRGPARVVKEIHEAFTTLLGYMIAIHVLGVLVDWLLTGENLVRAIWTGEKEVVDPAYSEEPLVGFWRAVVAAGVAIAVLWLVLA